MRRLVLGASLLAACGPLKVLPAVDPNLGRKGPTPPPLSNREGVTVLAHEPVPLDEPLDPKLLPEPPPERSVVGGRTITDSERRASDAATLRPDVPAVPSSKDLVVLPRPVAPAADASLEERGSYLYAVHCATCHGLGGAGDGPSAPALLYPPTDLTRVAERRGGVFVAEDIAAHIDGRVPHPSHLTSEEPVWGPEPRLSDPNSDGLMALLRFLETLQVEVAAEEGRS